MRLFSISTSHLLLLAAFALPAIAQEEKGEKRGPIRKEAVKKIDLRIDETGWGKTRHADVAAVLKSSCSELAVHLGDDLKLEPIRVRHGQTGPITHYKRTVRGEIMVLLSSKDRFWCQHAYQMAHEFAHILCRYKKGDRSNLWFEESLCELASIFAIREMAKTWQTEPPYPNWKNYSKALEDYAGDLLEKHSLPEDVSLEAWYGENAGALAEKETDRALNGKVAVKLLPLFEANPENWRAVVFLNEGRGDEQQTFKEYLGAWHKNCPEEHKPFVADLGKRFGVIQ